MQSTTVIMSSPEVLKRGGKEAVAAVVGFQMKHYKFSEMFHNITTECPSGSCDFTCNDTEVGSWLHLSSLSVADYKCDCKTKFWLKQIISWTCHFLKPRFFLYKGKCLSSLPKSWLNVNNLDSSPSVMAQCYKGSFFARQRSCLNKKTQGYFGWSSRFLPYFFSKVLILLHTEYCLGGHLSGSMVARQILVILFLQGFDPLILILLDQESFALVAIFLVWLFFFCLKW